MEVFGFDFSELYEKYQNEIIARSGFIIEVHAHEGLPELRDVSAYSRFNEGVIHVYLNHDLSREQAEVLVAHEITEQVMIRVEMYPNLFVTNLGALQKEWYGSLAAKIGSAILNAEVNGRLKEYGFDFEKLKEATLVRLVKRLPLMPPIINTEEEAVVNALIYLDHYLSYAPSPEIDVLMAYFKSVGESQWALAQSLVEIAEETGYRTVDQSLTCMIKIRDKLNLQPYILVRDRHNDSLQ